MSTWDESGFELPPVAEAVGPFCTRGFYEVVDRYDPGEPLTARSDDGFIPLRRVDQEVRFAGDAEFTDYHTPFGDGSEALIAQVAERERPARFLLDSLPEEAAKPLVAGLTEAGWEVSTRLGEVAAVVDLPGSFEEYLTSIGKKERHELRRKRRRYEKMVGEVVHVTHRASQRAVDEFVRLHRLSAGDKGRFMTEERQRLFEQLAGLEGWRLDGLAVEDGWAAMVFGYSDQTGYYLYNSAFDPQYSAASPGAVLLGTMIEAAIGEGAPRFDCLKGDEAYKFRLGARKRPLLEVTAVPG